MFLDINHWLSLISTLTRCLIICHDFRHWKHFLDILFAVQTLQIFQNNYNIEICNNMTSPHSLIWLCNMVPFWLTQRSLSNWMTGWIFSRSVNKIHAHSPGGDTGDWCSATLPSKSCVVDSVCHCFFILYIFILKYFGIVHGSMIHEVLSKRFKHYCWYFV